MKQVKTNQALGSDTALLPFVLGKVLVSDSNPYFGLHPKTMTNVSSSEPQLEKPIAQPMTLNLSKGHSPPPPSHNHLKSQTLDCSVSVPVLNFPILQDEYKSRDWSTGNCYTEDDFLYHVNRITGVYQLCIPLAIATDMISIAHGEEHPGFACYRKIVLRSWFITRLTRLLQAYI